MNLEPSSVAVGVLIGAVGIMLLLLIAAQMYADAMANGHDGEAGLWAWLRFSF